MPTPLNRRLRRCLPRAMPATASYEDADDAATPPRRCHAATAFDLFTPLCLHTPARLRYAVAVIFSIFRRQLTPADFLQTLALMPRALLLRCAADAFEAAKSVI